MFPSSQNTCTVQYKTGILWWLQHYVRASTGTVSSEVKLAVKQFEATLLCSQDIKQLTPSLSSLTSKEHTLDVLLMSCQVKQDLRLVTYVWDLQLLADPTRMLDVVLFILVYMKNKLQTTTFSNLKNVMHHFFVHFLSNRCGWTIWYIRFTSSTARLYCVIHFGWEIWGPLLFVSALSCHATWKWTILLSCCFS